LARILIPIGNARCGRAILPEGRGEKKGLQ